MYEKSMRIRVGGVDINNSVCQAHAQFIIDPVCHFSYVLTYYELIDVKQNYGTAILATGKIQFV